jgi:hypothetical protein
MPRIVDPEHAQREPELAVLSVMAHGGGDTEIAVQFALAAIDASERLDPDRRRLPFRRLTSSTSSQVIGAARALRAAYHRVG